VEKPPQIMEAERPEIRHFPWCCVVGCKGKDARAMLRLTVSDDLEARKRLSGSAGWFEMVRRDCGGK
jgi:hypothetical protein